MSQPSARVLLDSVTEDGDRITTVEVVHHRFILAEVNTHRALSRNSASSRAIPVEKMLKKFVEDPAYPAVWKAEQGGMQGGGELRKKDRDTANGLFHSWNWSTAVRIRDYFQELKDEYGEEWKEHALHKSWINRLMEPMQWHTAIWTFDHNLLYNFIDQRLHPDAQPEFYELMKVLKPALDESEPEVLKAGQWHMPLIRDDDYNELDDWYWNKETEDDIVALEMTKEQYVLEKLRKISVARCARVSYLTHEGVRDIAKDLDLHDRLADQNPPHASPFEHVCTPAPWNKDKVEVPQLDGSYKYYDTPKVGNLYGWLQMRHAIGMP